MYHKMWVNTVNFLMMIFYIKVAEAMLWSYMFAAHNYNYARYGFYHGRSMTRFGPEILYKFCRGEQSLHHNVGLYIGQWSTMFIETNWMRKGHGLSCIIGNTYRNLKRWQHGCTVCMQPYPWMANRRIWMGKRRLKWPTRRRVKWPTKRSSRVASVIDESVLLWSLLYYLMELLTRSYQALKCGPTRDCLKPF